MILDRNENRPVAVLLGAGSMGTAILRRVAAGKKLLLGDISEANLKRTADELKYSGYDVETFVVDACDKASVEEFAAKAASLGDVMTFIDTAGAFLLSADAAFITGTDLLVDGGTIAALKSGRFGLTIH